VTDVLVTRSLPDDIVAPLHDLGTVQVWDGDGPMPYGEMLEAVTDTRGILTMLTDEIDAGLIEAAPNLEVVSQMAVGLDNVDLEACRRLGVRVGHTPGVLTETVADTAFALMAAVVRRLPEARRLVRDGRWGPWSPFGMAGGDLHGATLGVVGMGRVGAAVARRASGFDMVVIYTSPREVRGAPGARVDLDLLVERADIVVLCAPLTPDTRGMIGRRELEMMGPGSYLVNVARGPLVVTDDLVTALDSGVIAGAALDVTDPEPLPPHHPLLGFDNCLVTPHIASASVGTRRAMARLAVENLIAALTGGEMPAEVVDDR
jgi:glyoxylate reductase